MEYRKKPITSCIWSISWKNHFKKEYGQWNGYSRFRGDIKFTKHIVGKNSYRKVGLKFCL